MAKTIRKEHSGNTLVIFLLALAIGGIIAATAFANYWLHLK